MIRTGRVVDGNDGLLKVCFNRPEACDHCSGCAGQKHETLVTITGDAPLGSMVDVDMPAARRICVRVMPRSMSSFQSLL